MQNLFRVLAVMLTAASWNALAQQDPPLRSKVDDLTKQLEPKLISLASRYSRASNWQLRNLVQKLVAEHLNKFDFDKEPIAHTGVVAALERARSGPVKRSGPIWMRYL
ncbi:MAG: hypothetical protein U1E85_06795 [Rhodocyclaceae bacterium]